MASSVITISTDLSTTNPALIFNSTAMAQRLPLKGFCASTLGSELAFGHEDLQQYRSIYNFLGTEFVCKLLGTTFAPNG